MARVRVLPSEIEFEAKLGDAIMTAAHAHGLYWPTTCGGQGICTTCLSEIVSGDECLSEMGRYERKTLISERGAAILEKPVRLICQAAVSADGIIVIRKPGVHAEA